MEASDRSERGSKREGSRPHTLAIRCLTYIEIDSIERTPEGVKKLATQFRDHHSLSVNNNSTPSCPPRLPVQVPLLVKKRQMLPFGAFENRDGAHLICRVIPLSRCFFFFIFGSNLSLLLAMAIVNTADCQFSLKPTVFVTF